MIEMERVRFEKAELVESVSKCLLKWKYSESGGKSSRFVEIVRNADGSLRELILRSSYNNPVKLSKTDLRIISELMRQNLLSKEEACLQPFEGEGGDED